MADLMAFWGGSAAAGRTRNAIYDPIDPHFATRHRPFGGDYHLKRQNFADLVCRHDHRINRFGTIRRPPFPARI
jgi:hypothetical protein